MVSVVKVFIRHVDEAALLFKALEGDAQATNQVIQCLASIDPHERQMMQETMHDLADRNLVSHLLGCLANQRWNGHRDCDRRADAETSERIDQAIIAVLKQDEYAWEDAIKESVLREALHDPDPHRRRAAAFLLGLRGRDEVIPSLAG